MHRPYRLDTFTIGGSSPSVFQTTPPQPARKSAFHIMRLIGRRRRCQPERIGRFYPRKIAGKISHADRPNIHASHAPPSCHPARPAPSNLLPRHAIATGKNTPKRRLIIGPNPYPSIHQRHITPFKFLAHRLQDHIGCKTCRSRSPRKARPQPPQSVTAPPSTEYSRH